MYQNQITVRIPLATLLTQDRGYNLKTAIDLEGHAATGNKILSYIEKR
jgi:hypothetical protein